MSDEHSIKLVLSDDLERRRATVLFRLILAIPHFIWLGVMSIVAVVVVIIAWFAALITGRTPAELHRFLAFYVKYVTQFYAYLYLVAEPYPSFYAADGYPVDLDIDPPAEQSRLTVLFRLPLAVPAVLMLTVLSGNGFSTATRNGKTTFSGRAGLLFVVAVFAWFATLARGRTPRGLRDAAAYSLSYAAQFWGYFLLLTDRYPDSDPFAAVPNLPHRSDPVRLEGEDDLRRSRLTIFFRLPLVLPHVVWLLAWSILAFFATLANWIATLATATPPPALHRFLSAYLRYTVSVYAFLYVLANPFPGFAGSPGGYPLDAIVAPAVRQSRWKVAFRLVLAVPALTLMSVYSAVASSAAFLGWFASLVTARMPKGLRNAGVLGLRYHAQGLAYLMVLTDAYPYTGPCFESSEPAPEPADQPDEPDEPEQPEQPEQSRQPEQPPQPAPPQQPEQPRQAGEPRPYDPFATEN